MEGADAELRRNAEMAYLSFTRSINVCRVLQVGKKTVLVRKSLQSTTDKYALEGLVREGRGDCWR